MAISNRFIVPILLLMSTVSAHGSTIYDTAAGDVTLEHVTGSRSIGNGLTGLDSYGTSFDIAWDIFLTPGGGGTITYQYTFSNYDFPGKGTGISHVILDLSDNCVTPGDSSCVSQVTGGGNPIPGSFDSSQGNSNHDLPSRIIGIKFDDDPDSIITFLSNRVPVWGDFYAKGGRNNAVWNIGNFDHSDLNTLDFIARPDSIVFSIGNIPSEVPEPAASLLLGAGLVGLALYRKRFQG